MKKIVLTAVQKLVLNEKMQAQVTKWQTFHSQQTNQTPIDVVIDILNEVDTDNKSVVVVANVDVFSVLTSFTNLGLINPKSLTLVTDVKALRDKVNVIYTESFKEIKLEKTFDVAILNPPYSEGQNKQLGYQIFSKIIDNVTTSCALILPLGQMSNKSIEKINSYGLYKRSEKQEKAFKIKMHSVHTFFFNKAIKLDINETSKLLAYSERRWAKNPISKIQHKGAKSTQRQTKVELLSLLNAKNGVIAELPSNATRVWLSGSTAGYVFNRDIISKTSNENTWRVVVAQATSLRKIGKLSIAKPGDLIWSAQHWVMNSEADCVKFIDYLYTKEVVDIIADVKVTIENSKKFFNYIETPDFLK